MFLIRDAREDDLPELKRLAKLLNTVNLPDDEDALRHLLDLAARSFAGRVRNPFDREYLFVMEDTAKGCLVGTSQVMARHGTRDAPHIYLDVLDEEHYSSTLDRHSKHKVLRLGFNYDGGTEIGGLVLDPAYRGHPQKLGKQLSFVRFVFMAMHRRQFRDRVIAELLPPFLDGGKSALWEALGARFTGMTYQEADILSKTNKEFIKALFPHGMIYTTLFDDDARRVIGEVGPQTKGVEKMLTDIGFEPMGRVDPFDGGPHFEAVTDDLWPVSQTLGGSVAVIDERALHDAGVTHEGIVAARPSQKGKKGPFRAVWSAFRKDDDDVISVPPSVVEALSLSVGASVHALSFAEHMRR
jgi:arginine N-succinyltransferase